MTEENDIKIEKLSSWDFSDTKTIYDGYDRKEIPEPTPRNMVIMMDKINELTNILNVLIDLNPAIADRIE